MGDGNLSFAGFHRQRLGVLDGARSGRGVTDMADGPCPRQLLQVALFENLTHQTHPPLDRESLSVIFCRNDSRALLPPMLEGIQPVIGQFCRIWMIVDPKNSTFMSGKMRSLQEDTLLRSIRFEKGEIFIIPPKLSATTR